jgi:hypothetical protein
MKGKMIPLVADVTSKDDLKRIAAQVESEQGYINLLSILSSLQVLTDSRELWYRRTPY